MSLQLPQTQVTSSQGFSSVTAVGPLTPATQVDVHEGDAMMQEVAGAIVGAGDNDAMDVDAAESTPESRRALIDQIFEGISDDEESDNEWVEGNVDAGAQEVVGKGKDKGYPAAVGDEDDESDGEEPGENDDEGLDSGDEEVLNNWKGNRN
ncbi:hypothetical protein FA95DRAFT_1684280 [Auriscalpium vulgare]|uniref:Uncharacterized protein n=1 Tax=Auriscalpium vulgare TaxID=40419 RepID=A0ACB8R6E0_9AGAM|nr:hypothetical protein FA95DRAFT_1684280 [Auriscalpium vulgare]